MGGHSSGGGLAIRFAGSQYGQLANVYLLLSPYLKYNAPTIKQNAGGWASTHMGIVVGEKAIPQMMKWITELNFLKNL